jgi:hypothetical protein
MYNDDPSSLSSTLKRESVLDSMVKESAFAVVVIDFLPCARCGGLWRVNSCSRMHVSFVILQWRFMSIPVWIELSLLTASLIVSRFVCLATNNLLLSFGSIPVSFEQTPINFLYPCPRCCMGLHWQ